MDLEAQPARVIDKVVVGDAPEGFAISPTGKLAVAVLLRGSNNAKTDWFYNRNGSVAVLKIDGKKVTKVGEVEVRGLPEGAVFSPDGRWLYVGNFLDSDISVLRVDGDTITNTGNATATAGQAGVDEREDAVRNQEAVGSNPGGSCFTAALVLPPRRTWPPNHPLQPTAASALRLPAVPSSLRSSAAAERSRWESPHVSLALMLLFVE